MKQSDRKFQKVFQKSKGNRLLAGMLCFSLILSAFAGISFVRPKRAEAAAKGNTLSNPRIVEDSSMQARQKVTWDCIWFGSYPQAEVVPASREYTALDKKLLQDGDLIKDDAVYQTLQAATGWDEQGDIEISGGKYRRIKGTDVTHRYDHSPLTNYYQWQNVTGYRYFKYQPIKWRVLSVGGSMALLLADKALDGKQYHTVDESVTWEGSTIRSWLNGYSASANQQKKDYSSSNFINIAFNASACKAIKDTNVDNMNNLSYYTVGGKGTVDKVFLLSESEVYGAINRTEAYGFDEGCSVHDEARRTESSVYAKALGIWSDGSASYVGNCEWWLRSPGIFSDCATYVDSNGSVYDNMLNRIINNKGVRPALKLNLAASSDAESSNLWSYAGTVCSDGTVDESGSGEEIDNPETPSTAPPTVPVTSQVKSFTLSPTVSGAPASTLSLSGTIYLKDGTTAADSEWEKLINSIAWTSSNPSVADNITVKRPAGLGETTYNTFIVSAQAKAEGTAVITGTLPNGMTASCAVTVTKEGAGDSGEHIERHVTGKLTDVNLNLWTVTIDNTEYAIGSTEFNMSAAQANLNKTVVARLLDNQVVQLDYVGDIAEARISLALGEDKLVYENGTFDKGTMTVSVELSCGAKSPYRDSDLRGTEAEHMSVQFTGFQVDLPEEGFYVGKSSAKKKRYETSISDSVTFGSTKKYSFEVNVDTGNYYPSKAAQSLKFYASAFSADGIAGTASAGLTVGNLDISRQNAANRYADSTDGQLLSEAGALLDQLTISSVSASLSGAGLDAQQIKNVETAVKAWIVNLMVIDILRQDTSQDTGWASLWEAAGISRPETQDFIAKVAVKAFKKLGLDVSAITSVSSFMNIQGREAYTTIKVPYKDSKKKYYTIAVTMKMTTYAFTSKQAFSGFGTLSYTVTDADGICVADESKLPVGVVTYADLETFAECVQEIGMRSIHKVYDKFMGSYLDKGKEKCRKMINENTENKLIELLTSDISNKLIEKRFGKFSDNVYKVFYGELEKKSKKTNVSVKCPVDIYIYDGEGDLCGSVINDQIQNVNDDIFLYTVGNRKYFTLYNDDYDIVFVGNGTGTMDYVIEEYEGAELLRTINYQDIPLTIGKTYYGTIPYTQMQSSEVYNPLEKETMETVMPVSDTRNTNSPDDKEDSNITSSPIPSPTLAPTQEPTAIPTQTPDTVPTEVPGSTPEPAEEPDDTEIDIAEAAEVTLGEDSYTYNGKPREPEAIVQTELEYLEEDVDYIVSYKNNTNVGVASVIVTGLGKYTGQITRTFKIFPKGTSLSGKLKAISKGFVVKWKKQTKCTSGYQVQYSTSKKFAKRATVTKTVKKKSVSKLAVRKLKAKKKYYVRIRTYRIARGRKYYSDWSKKRSIKTKK